MPLYRIQDVKNKIGEKGNTNNSKARQYGEDADSYIYSLLTNVRDLTIPLVSPPEILRDLATNLAVAYFFSGESGDIDLADRAEKRVDVWFKSTYMRPRFKARGPI